MVQNLLLQDWATGLWVDIGQPSNVAVTTISGYAIQPGTLGKLNSLIGTCFSGSGYAGTTGTANFQIGPWIADTELAIIGQMYLVSYYRSLAQATMGVGGNTIPWSMLREGDSTIQRSSPVNIGKEYREMAKDANEQLNYLVTAYSANSQGASVPRTVDYPSEVYPTWGPSYIGP